MSGRRGRWVAMGLLVVTACTADAPDAAPGAEAAADPSPFAVDGEIDGAYVQRVVDELLPRIDQAEREAVAAAPTSTLPEATVAAYEAVYAPGMAVPLLDGLEAYVADEAGAAALADELEEFGTSRWVVSGLGTVEEGCVPFAFDYAFSASDATQKGLGTLVAHDREPGGHNPTPWALGLNGTRDHLGEDLDSMCAASVESDREVLD